MASLGRLTMTRAQAKERGLTRYFSGKPCNRGHVSERQVSNSCCIDCLAENLKRWRINNKDKARQQWARSRANNPELANQRTKEWRKNNPNWDREYYKKNKEAILKANAEWKKANNEKVLAMKHRRRAKKKKAGGFHTGQDIKNLFRSQCGKCAGCGAALKKTGKGRFHTDHVMPIAKGGSDWPDNLQLLCPPCNQSKNAKHPDDWLMEIAANG